jgi:transcriptional regulator with XRE-family HTH domain
VADLYWDQLSYLVYEAGGEDHLAQRIVKERQQRGWSQERLAKEMTRVGRPTSQSSISKIERPVDGRRRDITADEAIALSRVFRIPLGELLLPAAALHNAGLLLEWERGPKVAEELLDVSETYDKVVRNVALGTRGSDEWQDKLDRQLTEARQALKIGTTQGPQAAQPEEVKRLQAQVRFLEDVARAREASK